MGGVLVVDDDLQLGENLSLMLELEGLSVRSAATANQALASARRHRPEVAIVDFMLPDMRGPDLVRALRGLGHPIAILMTSARGDVSDVVSGLEAGADDFLVKPFNGRELVARVLVQFRRLRQSAAAVYAERLEEGDLVLDSGRRLVLHGGGEVDLTRTEFELLWQLAALGGRVLTREAALSQVWPAGSGSGRRSVDTHMAVIRAKLRAGGCGREHVLTVRGWGYRLRMDALG